MSGAGSVGPRGAGGLAGAAAGPYRSAFKRWHQLASVRAPRRTGVEDAAHLCHFPPELTPVMHPEVEALGAQARERILVRCLQQYLNFTTELESVTVIPVVGLIARGESGVDVPMAMRSDAYKIGTDESWHAQFSFDLILTVSDRTGVPFDPVPSAFVSELERIGQEFPDRLRGMERQAFAIVSELLISRYLSDLPADDRLPGDVRELIADHALDEGRHHAYFKAFLKRLWATMDVRDRQALGPLLPALIRAFLAPDRGAMYAALAAERLAPEVARGVLDEVYDDAAVLETVAQGARPAVEYFRSLGMLDEPRTLEAFQMADLVADR
jgi:P-aminobenzoate N-oxygenase AurF